MAVMVSTLLLLLLAALTAQASQPKRCTNSDSFYFNVQPKSIQVKEGGRAFLECNVSNRCNIHFHWTLDERVVLNTTRRYQNGSNLIINRVNRTEDAGNFHCVATYATIARESQPAQLSIMWLSQNASVVLESPASTTEANAGGYDELRLRCAADGSDDLEYSWFYNGRVVKRAERTEIKAEYLTVRRPTAGDNGIYSCKVENQAGAVSSAHNFALSIQEEGIPIIATLPQDVIAPVGARVQLDCAYYNASQVKWRRVVNSNKALTGLSQLSTQLNNGTLIISSVTLADQGPYECLGFTDTAKIQQAYVAQLALASLKEFGESSFEPIKHLYAVGHGKRFEVACAPPAGFPEPQAYWTRDGRRLSSAGRVRSEGLQLVIDEAGQADGGKYVCIAENMAGRREGVLTVVVTAPPKIIRHPGSKDLLEGQNVYFDCKAEATPYPATSIEWEKDGEPVRAAPPRSAEPNRIQWNTENGSLSILNVELNDQGQYTCIVTTEGQDPVRSKEAELLVRKRLQFSPKPVDRKFEMGIEAQIPCTATGEIPPVIKWVQTKKLDIEGNVVEDYRPPRTQFLENVRSHNGTLYFAHIGFENAGVYLCAAVSKQGVIQEEIRVEVYVTPRYVKSPENKTVSEKRDVFYDCHAIGTPTPHVHWYFEGVAFDDQPNKIPFKNYEIFPNNTLVIRQTIIENAGKYMCMAGNKGGIRRTEALLCIHLKATNFTHCGRQLGLNAGAPGESDGIDGDVNGAAAQGIGLKTMAIACGVAFGYILLVVCLLAFCAYRRRRSSEKMPPQTQSDHINGVIDPLIVPGPRSLRPDTGNGSSHIGGSGSTPMVPLQPRQSPRSSSSKTTGANGLDRFAIGPERIDSDWNPLGSGVFGGVYLTKAYGVKHGEDCSLVLVKTLTSKDDHVHQQFREELDLFAKSNHENVAGLLGICREQDPIIVLFDYVTWGNVKHYMVWSRNRTEGPAPLNEAQIVSISYQVAQGMEHISDQRFVHKDLAARNILIGPGIADPSMRSQPLAVKISSLSLQEDTFMLEYHTHRNQVLPVRWLAPEVLADDDYSMKSDVWSFGVLLWELYSCGEMPYQLLSNDDVIREVQSSQLTLDVRECLPEAASDLMRSCWHSDPRHRPTFTDIRDITGQLHVETGL